jgi:GntR family transcriptional regulator
MLSMLSHFQIDRASATPVYVQLQEQVRLLVHRGVLASGDAMPTVRALAVELGINANTVARVYRELQQQGVLRLERGVGTFVARPEEASSLSEGDYQRIAQHARDLVQMSREAGLTVRELTQLIGSTWKESAS